MKLSTTCNETVKQQDAKSYISLEVFAATKINEAFSGRQPRQDVRVFRRFMD